MGCVCVEKGNNSCKGDSGVCIDCGLPPSSVLVRLWRRSNAVTTGGQYGGLYG